MPMLRCLKAVPPILCHFISSKISRVRAKHVADDLLIGSSGGHRHQSHELQVRHGIDLLGQVHRRADGHAVFLRFFRCVDLHQHRLRLLDFAGLRFQLFRQPQRIDAVNQR